MSEFRCDACDREFGSSDALEMHNSVKHSSEKGEEKSSVGSRSKIKSYGFMLIVFALLVWGGSSLMKKQESYDNFSLCLEEAGAEIYGAYWCSACAQQKRILGESENIPWVECSLPNRGGQTAICIAENIQSYPTWKFADGSTIVGVMTLEDLGAKTGCVVASD